MNRIRRAKAQNKVMTIIFYAIAVFFFVLLAAFAGYVIIKGFILGLIYYVQIFTPRKHRKPVI